jgi:hypothetical protein
VASLEKWSSNGSREPITCQVELFYISMRIGLEFCWRCGLCHQVVVFESLDRNLAVPNIEREEKDKIITPVIDI